MPLTFNDGAGVKRVITKLSQKQIDGTLRKMATLKVKDAGGTLRTIATFTSPLTVTLSTNYIVRTGYISTITTDYVTATPAGGTAPYIYSWVRTSGTCLIGSATSAVTNFTETGMGTNADRVSTATLTVTDSAGQTASAGITIEIIRGSFA